MFACSEGFWEASLQSPQIRVFASWSPCNIFLNKQGIISRMFTFLHLWNLNDPFRIQGYSRHKDRAKPG